MDGATGVGPVGGAPGVGARSRGVAAGSGTTGPEPTPALTVAGDPSAVPVDARVQVPPAREPTGVSTYRAYGRPVGRPNRAAEAPAARSHAAIPVALAVVGFGLYLGRYSILITALLGIVLLYSGGSFLSTRLNPLSPHFYLTRKPSWAAVGVVFLGAAALLGAAYAMWLHGMGPVFPHF